MYAMPSVLEFVIFISQFCGTTHAITCNGADGSCGAAEADAGSTMLATQAVSRRETLTIAEASSFTFKGAGQASTQSLKLVITVFGASQLPLATEGFEDLELSSDAPSFTPLAACRGPGGGYVVQTALPTSSSDRAWKYTDELAGWTSGDSVTCAVRYEASVNGETVEVPVGEATLQYGNAATDFNESKPFDGEVAVGAAGAKLRLKVQLERVVIYFDGKHGTPVPKKPVESAPEVMFVSIPLDKTTGVKVLELPDGRKMVNMDFGAQLQGLYYRNSMVANGDMASDWGVANYMLSNNPLSFYPGSKVGFVEKTLVVGQDGAVSDASQQLQEEEVANRKLQEKHMAKLAAKQRHKLVTAENMKMGIFKNLILGGVDPNQGLAALMARLNVLQQAKALNDTLQPLKPTMMNTVFDDLKADSTACFHIPDFPGTALQDALVVSETGMRVLTDMEFFGYRSVTMFAPLAKFSTEAVKYVFHHNEYSNSIELAIVAVSKVLLEDPKLPGGPNPVYFQGPPHTSADARTSASTRDPTSHYLYNVVRSLHADYDWLWENADCDEPTARAKMQDRLESFSWGLFMHKSMTGQLNQMDKDFAINLTVDALACGKGLIRAPKPSSHAYGLMESSVWQHAIMELPSDTVWQAVTHDFNNMDILTTN